MGQPVRAERATCPPLERRRIQVLLVEDDPDDSLLVAEMLADDTHATYDLDVAATATEALERVARSPPDAVLLDLSLPDSRDLGAFHAMRAAHPAAPILVLTGLTDEAVAQTAVAAGAQDYLLKREIDGVTLGRALRYAIGRKRAEQALLASEEHSRQLEAQLLHAHKLEAVGQLAVGVAHEINTPAQYIGDNLRFLGEAFGELEGAVTALRRLLAAAREGPPAPDLVDEVAAAVEAADIAYLLAEVPSAIEQTQDGAARIAEIVRAMKEFSHPGVDAAEVVDVNRLVASTVTVARNEWKYVAELTTELAEDLPAYRGHVGELGQVVLNLVVNAAHAVADSARVADGGKGRIAVRTAVEDGAIVIGVADDGCGVPEAVRARIFEPFFTTKQAGRGTGQGLAIARAVVDRHGGTIEVSSVPGEGSTFAIRLPLPGLDPTEELVA